MGHQNGRAGKRKLRCPVIIVTVCAIAVCGFFMGKSIIPVFVKMEGLREQSYKIVVDAGHGGDDPGKVGNNGTLEKDLNLLYAQELTALLEENGVTVVMTREDDNGLYSAQSENKKLEDLRARCALVTEEKPDLVVSIHQNSYSDASVKGAQVFYFGQSEEGEAAAAVIQDALNEQINTERAREAKANESYYILKKTSAPTVIVECGFLSCPEEEALLNTAAYRKKVVRAICDGVMQYLM